MAENPLSFLDLPEHESKPRSKGLTSVIDAGASLACFEDVISSTGEYIDFVKFGWGTSVVTPIIEAKINILKENGIDFWFGGTLFEICYSQGKLDKYLKWVESTGTKYFEISDGIINIELETKCGIVRDLSKDFNVLSEIGSKDSEEVMSPSQWIQHIEKELEAGAWKLIAEGRESGTAGIYRNTGDVRLGLVHEIDEAGVDFDRIFFETPQKVQQIWFLSNFGPNINLSNIAITDVIGLETLRLGLRSDMAQTLGTINHPKRRSTDR